MNSRAPPANSGHPAFAVGIVANFLDTLGCGSYAPSTFMYKLFNQIDDINIPGTLNVGDTFPVIFEAFIFTASVDVDPVFLLIMYVCAAVGSFGFATIVTKWPRNKIRWALGSHHDPACNHHALQEYTGWGPFGIVGTATTLTGWQLIVAAALNILWGALMDIGFGLYAPCMATCLLLGVDATAAFPVFMGSCACLMPACSIEFIKTKRYDVPHTVGNAIGGCVGVFLAWKLVTSLPMFWLINLVCVVLLWTSYTLISAAAQGQKSRSSLKQELLNTINSTYKFS